MLDVGCGQHYPETLLFHNDGNQVTGIDLDVVGVGLSWRKYAGHRATERRQAGRQEPGARACLRSHLLRRAAAAGRTYAQPPRGWTCARADAAALPFADGNI